MPCLSLLSTSTYEIGVHIQRMRRASQNLCVRYLIHVPYPVQILKPTCLTVCLPYLCQCVLVWRAIQESHCHTRVCICKRNNLNLKRGPYPDESADILVRDLQASEQKARKEREVLVAIDQSVNIKGRLIKSRCETNRGTASCPPWASFGSQVGFAAEIMGESSNLVELFRLSTRIVTFPAANLGSSLMASAVLLLQ